MAAARVAPQRELLLIYGLPGAGKSHYVEQFLSQGDYRLLSLDNTFEQMRSDYPDLTDDQIAQSHWKEAVQRLKSELDEAVQRGDNIIYEATNLTVEARKERLDAVKASPDFHYRTKAVYIYPPEAEEHTARLMSRGLRECRLGSLEKIDSYYNQLVLPACGEGFDEILMIGTPPKRIINEEYRRPSTLHLADICRDGTLPASLEASPSTPSHGFS